MSRTITNAEQSKSNEKNNIAAKLRIEEIVWALQAFEATNESIIIESWKRMWMRKNVGDVLGSHSRLFFFLLANPFFYHLVVFDIFVTAYLLFKQRKSD